MKPLPILSVALFVGLGAAALATNSCSGGGTKKADPDARPLPDAAIDDAGVELRCDPQTGTDLALQEVVRGLTDPLFLVAPAGDERRFVVEQPGSIKIINTDDELLPAAFLDIEDIVRDNSNEQGLLGLAFHPDYATNGKFYVNYTATSPTGATVVAEYTVSSNADVADAASARILLTIPQFAGNHNGGMIAFGADGYLYIGTGDGGGGNDPEENGQDLNELLGKMLRIDVDSGSPYGIPADNPFAGGGGEPEIWAYGLRNPWRFSFDRDTGEIYIGDVGQGNLEEINVQSGTAAGLNYGWKIAEGSECRGGGLACDMSGLVPPVHDVGRGEARSITGGYVYRGECLPDIKGWYIFGDYVTDRLWKFEHNNGNADDLLEITGSLDPNGDINGLTSFGEDAFGELYVISRDGKVFQIIANPN